MIIALAFISAHAVAEASFDEGLRALREGDAGTAASQFEAALAEGHRHPAVYHGLGNALYRLGRKPEAIAAWRRGLALAPRNGDIAANLALVRPSLVDRIDPPATHHPAFFWQSFLAPVETAWTAAVLLALAIWWRVWGQLQVFRGRIQRLRGGGGIVWTLVMAGLVLAASTAETLLHRRGAVVTADEIEVRSALGPSGVALFVLHAGAEVAIEDSTDTHRLISLSDGRKGWVHADVLLSTDPAQPFGTSR